MSLSEDIKDAINQNLPATVGAMLQARLKQADVDAAKILDLTADLNVLKGEREARAVADKEVARLTAVLKAQEEKAKALDWKALELTFQEKLLDQREKATEVRVGDLKDIVKTVFCSPVSKSKLVEYVNEPVMNNGYPAGT